MKLWVGRLLAALTLSLAPVVLLAGAANAGVPANSGAYGTSFVDGGGTPADDWNENYDELGHSLCRGCADSNGTDLVVLWQTVLYAEGILPASGIDGYFGDGTLKATIVWQKLHGIGADGYVGDTSWRFAGDRLDWWVVNGVTYLRYDAKQGSGWVEFYRGSSAVDYDGGAFTLRRAQGSGSSISFGNNSSTPRIHFHKWTIVKM